MTDYPYRDLPLTPIIATSLIIEFLATQAKPIERVDITRHVADRHASLGGENARDPLRSVKKALTRLVEEGTARRHALGWYSLVDRGAVAQSLGAETSVIIPQEPVGALTPEETTGEGDELVYVYFSESERRLALLEKRDQWDCKVGYTTGNLTSRILGQGTGTSMARLPTVGLVIRTNDGHGLERAIHFALEEAAARIDDAVGDEWFNTSPRRILDWYNAHQQAVSALRRSNN